MKKIMFNDKYGQTKDVLEGRKTQERKIIKMPDYDEEYLDTAFDWDFRESVIIDRYAKYKVGEIVAIAQSYHTIYDEFGLETMDMLVTKLKESKGWTNKMFIKPEIMSHQIRITNVRIQRLQDIRPEDCIKEGVIVNEFKIKGSVKSYYPCEYLKECANRVGWGKVYNTLREAYAVLIDELKGKGTWESNPYVFVYDFKLIK